MAQDSVRLHNEDTWSCDGVLGQSASIVSM
jgi:hypothetical protein